MTSRKPAGNTAAGARTETMRTGRQADSARRRQHVLTALDRATASGTGISASGIARAAGFSELKTIIDIDRLMAASRTHGGRF